MRIMMVLLLLLVSCDDTEYKKRLCEDLKYRCKAACYRVAFARKGEREECVDACLSGHPRCKVK